MKTFLNKVVKKTLSQKIDLDKLIFVLPNQRAGVYLREILKQNITQTNFLPQIITFDNLAEQITSTPKTSATELLFDFYSVYLKETPKEQADSFESFSGWAGIVLDDFNDIDGNLVPPKKIFANLKAINEIHNWSPDTEITKNYLVFFQKLETYYTAFYQYLLLNNKGYQGMILREAVQTLEHFMAHNHSRFVFAGFNYLKKSEAQIIQELLSADKAQVFWNISKNLLDKRHLAGHYIRSYQSEWAYYKTNTLNWVSDSVFQPENIGIIGIPKNVGMLKYAGELIANNTNHLETALVMADQNILAVAINSLPKGEKSINITMGVPLKNFPFSDFALQLFQLHINRNANDTKGYYYQSLLQVLQHPIIVKHITGATALLKALTKKNKVYISLDDIKTHKKCFETADYALILKLLTPIEEGKVTPILDKLNTLIQHIKDRVNPSEKEVLYRHFQLHLQLSFLLEKHTYISNLKALFQLYRKLLVSENITFLGKPNEGIQLMGFLETQAIAFEHLIITSVNEGILPKGKQSNSFIPFDIRKEFDLLIYTDEDAIASYNFYRLIQTATKVSILYNTETDRMGSGEKSRFLTQLLWEYPQITQKLVTPSIQSTPVKLAQVTKTPAVITKLEALAVKGFSPSSLGSYIYNPIDFYYKKILGIKELDEIEETVADNTMGTVLHYTLEDLYKPFIGRILTLIDLTSLLPNIPEKVQFFFKEKYPNGIISQGKNKLIYEVVVNFITRFIKSEIKEVKQGKEIKILALEKKLSHDFKFPSFDFPIKIHGEVDRIDEVDGVIRIVDYKSGMVSLGQLKLDDFDKILTNYKYSKALQVMLYAYLYTQKTSFNFGKPLEAGILSFKNLKAGFLPVHFTGGKNKDTRISTEHLEVFLETLEDLFLEIYDKDKPFEEVIR